MAVSSVAVIGAGGPTGFECVKRLLSATNYSVRAVVRDPTKYESTFPKDSRLSVVPGDVTDPASLSQALQGCDAAIFAASGKGYWSANSVDHLGVANMASAAKAAALGHVVMVSSQLVSPHQRWHPMRILLNNIRWGLMDAKLAGEQALRASGVPYTIVRPGGLSKAEGGVVVKTSQGDTGKAAASPIGREVVAAICVAALSSPEAAKGVTVEVSGSKEALAPAQFTEHVSGLFKGLNKDAAAPKA